MTLTELEARALRLSTRERALLAKHLLASLEESVDPDAEQAWLSEVENRCREYKKGRVPTMPAAEAFRKARARLR
ncbi:MAG: addiction module protein [Phycisphaerae bacterium]|nr:addiction module protein [Phycisphaerae bacterium]